VKKAFFLSVFLCSVVFTASADADIVNDKSEMSEEFSELGEPQKNIGGAYYGLGLSLSMTSHNLKGTKPRSEELNFKSSSNQKDISLIGGFGAAFYKRYYAGIEMDFFKRFSGSTNYSHDRQLGIAHNSAMGLNMDVRFGYLYPQYGYLVYGTFGFARIQGQALLNCGSYYAEGSFGSFYPTFGAGIEKRLNHHWNIRADFRISATVKDDNRYIRGTTWKYEAKPGRTAFRFSVIRSI
jgi:hypothetical protein